MSVATYLLVCISACSVPNATTGAVQQVTAGYVADRILWDGATPYTPAAGFEIKADDGTPIGGTTTP